MSAMLEASGKVTMLRLAAHIRATLLSGEPNMGATRRWNHGLLAWEKHEAKDNLLAWACRRLAPAAQLLRMRGRGDRVCSSVAPANAPWRA